MEFVITSMDRSSGICTAGNDYGNNARHFEYADSVVLNSMTQYLEESGNGNKIDCHFMRRSDEIMDVTAFKVVDKMRESQSDLTEIQPCHQATSNG